jgi:hypothetical protein
MQKNLHNLHSQREHDKNTLCWVLYSVNDGKDVEEKNVEIMICILYYTNPVNNREKT